MKIIHVKPGRPISLEAQINHQLVCCDCGLVHEIRIVAAKIGGRSGATVEIVMKRNELQTKKERALMKRRSN